VQRRPLTWLLGLLTAALGVPTVVRLAGDHGLEPLVILDVAVPLVFLPLAMVAVLQVVLNRRWLALVTALFLALDALWLVPLYVPDSVPRGLALTVLTANLKFGAADPAVLVRLVKNHHVDVLAAEELTPAAVDRLRAAGLEQELPFTDLAARPFADGTGLWSRYPLAEQAPFVLHFQSPGAVVQLPGRTVVVRAVHPLPPTDGPSYRADYAALRRQVGALDPTVPTVLAGDFNASNDNALFRRLLGNRFRDASEVAGSGVHGTWTPSGWPYLLHLDHVLVDRHLGVRSTEVFQLPESDHSAVIARLVVR
jgi:endonuclease/exonuclease/phosphatase (EEP) superfamily protein YafD